MTGYLKSSCYYNRLKSLTDQAAVLISKMMGTVTMTLT